MQHKTMPAIPEATAESERILRDIQGFKKQEDGTWLNSTGDVRAYIKEVMLVPSAIVVYDRVYGEKHW
jgi:hypothetical protein